MTTWAVKDHNGQILPDLRGSSRFEVGCRVLPARYDVFRLHVSASYRELFERALQHVLEQNRWQIIEIKHRKPPGALTQWGCDSHAAAAARLGNVPAKRRHGRTCRRKRHRAILCGFAMLRRGRRSLRDARRHCDRKGFSETSILQCGGPPPPRTTRCPWGRRSSS